MILMTYEATAKYLGRTVKTLRNLVSEERIPVLGPRGSRHFCQEHLDQWLKKGKPKDWKWILDENKECPKCGSKRVIVFDADNDICENCKHWFPGS